MAKWQMMKGGKPTKDPLFDDGHPEQPGDDGFTTADAAAQAQSLGATAFNYVGASDVPPQPA